MSLCSCDTLYERPDPLCSVHGADAQPLPTPNDHPAIHGLVQADLDQRLAYGVAKYGIALQPHNGRDTLRDAYEEALDLAVYLRSLIYERDHPTR